MSVAEWKTSLKQYDNWILFFGLVGSLLAAFASLICWADASVLDAIFFTLQMVVLNFSKPDGNMPSSGFWYTVFQITRLTIPLFASWALIKGYMRLAGHTVDRGIIKRYSDHVVVCGGGVQARVVAEQHLANGLKGQSGKEVVIVTLDAHTPELEKLKSSGAKVVEADATDPLELRRLGVAQAKVVYILAGADEVNTQILEALRKAKSDDFKDGHVVWRFLEIIVSTPARNRKRPTLCLVHVFDDLLSESVQHYTENWRKTDSLSVRTFNAWKESARRLLVDAGPDKFTPVREPGAPQPHVLLIGYSWFGQQVLEQLARLGHFAHDRRVRVTVIAQPGSHAMKRLLGRFPALDPDRNAAGWEEARPLVPVIDLRVVETPLDGISLRDIVTPDDPPISVAYVCAENVESGLSTAHSLRLQAPAAPFPIYLAAQKGMSDVKSLIRGEARRIETFDALEAGLHLYTGEEHLWQYAEREAALVHLYFSTQYSSADVPGTSARSPFALAETLRTSTKSDPTSAEWRAIEEYWNTIPEEWEKESSRDVIRHLVIKERFAGTALSAFILSDATREQLCRMEHARWSAERLLTGWRHGRLRNNMHLQHPHLVPFDNLHPDTRSKDAFIIEVSRLIHQARASGIQSKSSQECSIAEEPPGKLV